MKKKSKVEVTNRIKNRVQILNYQVKDLTDRFDKWGKKIKHDTQKK